MLALITIPPYLWTREAWPLDGMKFDTLKERHAKRNPEDLIIDYGDHLSTIACLILSYMNTVSWKLCILYSAFLLRRSISKRGRWRSSCWRRGQFGPICFWYTRTNSIPWEWRGGGRGTHPCWSWRRLGPDHIQPHSKRKTSTDGCLPCHQTRCIRRRVRACCGHTKQEPCLASSGP